MLTASWISSGVIGSKGWRLTEVAEVELGDASIFELSPYTTELVVCTETLEFRDARVRRNSRERRDETVLI
jgi:hypothetical protein